MPSNNLCVIASAGSRKTTFLVEEAIKNPSKRILITTYTNENLSQITSYVVDRLGCVPSNMTIMSWYTFLLQDGVRPYQKTLTSLPRVVSINFISQKGFFTKKTDVDRYYFDGKPNIYRDAVSDFVVATNTATDGKVIDRVASIYDVIMVDEVQDLAGYDLQVIELLLKCPAQLILVGDPRQSTYSTNNSSKNKKYKREGIVEWFQERQQQDLCVIEERKECFRCNQAICEFADALYPALTKTVSKNGEVTGHDGIFTIEVDKVSDYIQQYSPTVLRYSKRTDTFGNPAKNIGAVKGQTFDRVLIFPTQPMKKYLSTKDLTKAGDISKLYVAATRARFSATFVV